MQDFNTPWWTGTDEAGGKHSREEGFTLKGNNLSQWCIKCKCFCQCCWSFKQEDQPEDETAKAIYYAPERARTYDSVMG